MAASSLTAAAKAARLDISQSGVEESPASSTQTSARKPDELNPGKALMEDSAAMFEDESKNWFLLSSYHFLPQGVVVVKEAFEKEIKAQGLVVGKDVRADYDIGSHIWYMRCLNTTGSFRIYIALHNIVQNIIREETDGVDFELEDDEPLESNLIQRIVGAKREISTHEEYPEAINFYSHRFRWSCSDDRQRLNSIVTRTIAAKIALLTSTTLEIDLNKQTVFIGGHDGIDVDLAVQKLDVVRKYFYIFEKRPMIPIYHILHPEEETEYRTTFTPFEHMRKVAVNTLFDHIKTNIPISNFTYEWLKGKCSVSFCGYQASSNEFSLELRSRPKAIGLGKQATTIVSKFWDRYEYPGHGTSSIRQEDLSAQGNVTVDVMVQSHPDPARARIAGWIAEIEENPEKVPELQPMYPNIGSGDDLICFDRPEGHANNEAFGSSQDLCLSPAVLTQPLEAEQSKETEETEEMFFSPRIPNLTKAMQKSPAGHSTQSAPPSQHNAVSLMDDDADNFSVWTPPGVPRVMESQEIASRIFHNTMRQRAGKGNRKDVIKGKTSKAKSTYMKEVASLFNPAPTQAHARHVEDLPDPTSDFCQQLEIILRESLDCMRSWDGGCIMEAQIGRIIIGNIHDHFINSDHEPHSKQQLPAKTITLLREMGESMFTRVLTTLPIEIEPLLLQEDARGKKLWSSSVPIWTVSYEIIGANPRDQEAVILEIDAETFEIEAFSSPKHFGEIYTHAIKRNWDVRFEATGKTVTREKYAGLMKDIKTNAYIAPNQRFFSLDFQYAAKHDVEIHSVRCHRKSSFLSTNGLSYLHVNEIHRLDLNQTEVTVPGKDPVRLVRGTPAVKQPGLEPLWYEISVTSKLIDTTFAKSKTLEIGEEAPWTVDQFSSPAGLEAMYRPALAIVKNMDSVGFSNNNGLRFPEGETVDYSSRSAPPVSEPVALKPARTRGDVLKSDPSYW